MKAGAAPAKSAALEYGAVLARWLLGALFVYMGLGKALHPVEFLKLTRAYELTSSSLALNVIAAVLPWFEVFCGILLLAGVAVRGAALLLLGLLAPFTFVVLQRALDIATERHLPLCAVQFDCGCGSGEVFICRKIAENIFLMGLCGFLLLSGRGGKWACWFAPFGKRCSTGEDRGAGLPRPRVSPCRPPAGPG